MFYDDGTNVGYLGDNPKDKSQPVFGGENGALYDNTVILSGDDDAVMRQAEALARQEWLDEYNNGQRYNHPLFNDDRKFDCQEFIFRMLEKYRELNNQGGDKC